MHKRLMRFFGASSIVTFLAFLLAICFLGSRAAAIFLMLAIIEIAFSFDNAIINAQVLMTLSLRWRKIFLSAGILIAVFGVRVLLPLYVVQLVAHKSFNLVLFTALHNPLEYARLLSTAQPVISAFGGAFLFALTLRFYFNKAPIQMYIAAKAALLKPCLWLAEYLLALIATLAILVFLNGGNVSLRLLLAVSFGIISNGVIRLVLTLTSRLYKEEPAVLHTGYRALVTLLYLELLDASLSLDGVAGAFAITNNILLISLGLGAGAFWVRSLSVYLVRQQTINSYRYLDGGAHLAIGILAISMLVNTVISLPGYLSGVLCLLVIAAAIGLSMRAKE